VLRRGMPAAIRGAIQMVGWSLAKRASDHDAAGEQHVLDASIMVAPIILKCGRAARSDLSDQRFTNLGAAAAAVLHEEPSKVAHSSEAGAVDNRPAMTLSFDQSSSRQHREMRRHRVVRNAEPPRHITGRQATRLVLDQQPENF